MVRTHIAINSIIDMETLLIMIVFHTAKTTLERNQCMGLLGEGLGFHNLGTYL